MNDSKKTRGDKLAIRMYPRTDKDGNQYYLGKLKFPGSIDCKDGISIFFFNSEEGVEEVQIGSISPREKVNNHED